MDQNRLKDLLERVVHNAHVDEIELIDALEELDDMSKQPALDRQLEHYLTKRSYEKALTLLVTGRSCGHH